MNRRAAEKELRVFNAFADHAPIKIKPDSIQSMQPPAPDILCELASGEHIAFELVELIDQGYARDLDALFQTLRLLHDLPDRLPSDLRCALEGRLGGKAYISFDFAEGLPLREREAAVMDALWWLVKSVDPIEDHNNVLGEPLQTKMRTVHVHRWDWEMRFETSSYMRIADPTLERLRAKFRKTYVSQHPIELLMYTEVDLIFPDSTWLPTVDPFVQQEIAASPFRRVWLWKGGKKQVGYVYPPL